MEAGTESQTAKAARRSPEGEGGPRSVTTFVYVYTLESLSSPGNDPTCRVPVLSLIFDKLPDGVGLTQNLRGRLERHNAGSVPHTSKDCPWRIKSAVAFTDESRALEFERYLKTASGRAFAKKRL